MALQAKANAEKTGSDFDRGIKMGYYEVLSLLQYEAGVFGIPFNDIKLDKIDPDRDLL